MHAATRLLAATVLSAMCAFTFAQSSYPVKPVRLVVPMPPGGSNDILARSVSEKLALAWGHPVIVDNRPGAGSIIGTDSVAKAPADGYTVLIVSSSFTIQPAVQRNLPYDPATDFAPIAMIGRGPLILIVHPSLPVKSVSELIQLARSRPGELNFGSPGNGTINHLATELFRLKAKVNLVHVPYKGIAPAITDLVGGHTQLVIATPSASLAHIKSGRVRALGVTSAERWPLLKELPTIAESGAPGYVADIWWGFVGPAKTPPAIVKQMNAEIRKILAVPEIRERFVREGIAATPGTPDAFANVVQASIAQWKKVVADAHIKLE